MFSDGLWSKISSPLIDTKLESFLAKFTSSSRLSGPRNEFKGGLTKKARRLKFAVQFVTLSERSSDLKDGRDWRGAKSPPAHTNCYQ